MFVYYSANNQTCFKLTCVYSEPRYTPLENWDIIIIIVVVVVVVVVVAVVVETELSLGGSSPYTSTDKTDKNKHT